MNNGPNSQHPLQPIDRAMILALVLSLLPLGVMALIFHIPKTERKGLAVPGSSESLGAPKGLGCHPNKPLMRMGFGIEPMASRDITGDTLQKPKQSVVLARLWSAVRGCLRIASAVANSAACPQVTGSAIAIGRESKDNVNGGSKEKLRGKGESLSQKPLRECGIASPAPAQQKVTANPKSGYAPQSPIMVGATNFNPWKECSPALGRLLKDRLRKRLLAGTQSVERDTAKSLCQDVAGHPISARDSDKAPSGQPPWEHAVTCAPIDLAGGTSAGVSLAPPQDHREFSNDHTVKLTRSAIPAKTGSGFETSGPIASELLHAASQSFSPTKTPQPRWTGCRLGVLLGIQGAVRRIA